MYPEKGNVKYEIVFQLSKEGSPQGNNGWGVFVFLYPLDIAVDFNLVVSAYKLCGALLDEILKKSAKFWKFQVSLRNHRDSGYFCDSDC